MKYRAGPAIALAFVLDGSTVCAAETTPPPPPPEAARPSFGIGHDVPPAGQWVWQQSIYGGGGGYWAFIKPPDLRDYHGFKTPGGP